MSVTGGLNGKGEMCGGIWEVQGKRGVYRIIWGDIGETSHLEGTGEERGVQDCLGDLSERSHLEELGIDKLKLLKLILKK